MSNKVYVMTDGEYSDFHIVGVYRTKEAAEAYIANEISKYFGGSIEEYEFLDDHPLATPYDVLILAYTSMECSWADLHQVAHFYTMRGSQPPLGEIIEKHDKFMDRGSHTAERRYPEGVPDAEFHAGKHEGVLVAAIVTGTDHEKVRKIMSEKIALIKAQAYLVGGE